MAYIFKNYGIHFIFVLICIVLSVVASIQGTLFMQRLIDDYIMPMIGQKTPDFGKLFRERFHCTPAQYRRNWHDRYKNQRI